MDSSPTAAASDAPDDSLASLVRRVLLSSVPDAVEPPPLLGDRYTLHERIGAGGMGVVFRATDLRLGRPVAVKCVPLGSRDEERLLREARAAARVESPHVVRMLDAGKDGGFAFLVMDLVDGSTLRARLAEAPVDRATAAKIGLGIAQGLAAVHRAGIVHRDLKPANVVVDASGEAKILDFGISRAPLASTEAALTREGALVGTPAYMSPEQAAGGAIDARSDVFSLGLVLAELWTGKRVLEGSAATVVARLRTFDVADVAPLFRGLPVEKTLLACLARDPARRPADGDAVEAQLRSSSERGIPRAGLLGGAVAAVVGGAVVFLVPSAHGTPLDGASVARVAEADRETAGFGVLDTATVARRLAPLGWSLESDWEDRGLCPGWSWLAQRGDGTATISVHRCPSSDLVTTSDVPSRRRGTSTLEVHFLSPSDAERVLDALTAP